MNGGTIAARTRASFAKATVARQSASLQGNGPRNGGPRSVVAKAINFVRSSARHRRPSGKGETMRMKLLCLALLVLATGCISLPESADEHDQSVEFARQLRQEPRVAAILSNKPRKRFGLQPDSRTIFIIVNSPQVIEFSFVPGIPNKSVPGNQYTPEEVAVIEDAALSIKNKLGIERNIMIYDESTNRGHHAKRLPADPGIKAP